MDIDLLARQLEALGAPTRLRIYLRLAEAGASGLPVGPLQAALGIGAASTLSHHLQKMLAVGLVTQERHSTTLICKVDRRSTDTIVAFLLDAWPSHSP